MDRPDGSRCRYARVVSIEVPFRSCHTGSPIGRTRAAWWGASTVKRMPWFASSSRVSRSNSVSRIVDAENCIVKLVNNYAKISFNFGPTLLSWLEAKSPDVYAAILQADKESQKRFSGHGSAMAQIFNHVIMPLANSR